MSRLFPSGLAMCLAFSSGWVHADTRTVLQGGSELLSAGATAIRAGRYDEGILLTSQGLERDSPPPVDRAAALSNLCAAHAAKAEPDRAIEYCSESLSLNRNNWRAYSNRAYAYLLKGMYSEATFDVDAAAAINPRAEQVMTIKGLINESSLQPRVIMEDHQ